MFILKNRTVLDLTSREMGEFVGSKFFLQSIQTVLINKMFGGRMNIVKSRRCAERCFTYLFILFYSIDDKLFQKKYL